MRISAKGRYALAALVEVARQTQKGAVVSVVSISKKLGISKIFLEHIAMALKKGALLQSTKGAKGGYQLAREAGKISAFQVLSVVENTLLEKTDNTVLETSPGTEAALREKVFNRLEKAVEDCLAAVTLQELLEYAERQNSEQAFMLNL